MADAFIAEIRIFPFNFAPKGWAFCDGQLLPISQNTALFSLVGTIYGGDGKSTFALPDLQGSAPIFWGQGPGLSLYDEGQTGGTETVTLLQSETPVHTHSLLASPDPADHVAPGATESLAASNPGTIYQTNTNPDTTLAPQAVSQMGGDLPHNNMQPYLTLNFCIALQGIYPARS